MLNSLEVRSLVKETYESLVLESGMLDISVEEIKEELEYNSNVSLNEETIFEIINN